MTTSADQLRTLAGRVSAAKPLPDAVLLVHAHLHPLKIESTLVVVPMGATLRQIVDACGTQAGASGMARGAVVYLNGEPVPTKLWLMIRPKATAHIVVRAVAGAFVAIPVIGALAKAIGLTPFATSLITAVASTALSFALNALMAPSPTEADATKTLYAIAGARNEVAKWSPVPQVLGRKRVSAKYAAGAYTTFEGNDQYVTMLLVWSIGPCDVADIKIGETPIGRFRDVTIQTRRGYPDDDKQTLYTREVVQDDLSAKLSKKDPTVRTSADAAYKLAIDIVCPGGLYESKTKGYDDHHAEFEIRYRPAGSGPYTLLRKVVLEGDSPDPIRKTYTFDVEDGRYDVRIQRTNASDKSEDDKFQDEVIWAALKSYRRSKPIEGMPPLAITALRIRATEQLNGTPDDVNAVVHTRGKGWTGSAWIDDTRISNPAALFRHVLQGRANRKPVPDSRIDLTTLQRWHDYCRGKGFAFNMNCDFKATVWDTLRDVCAAGRAMPVFRDGRWSVTWEEANAPVVQHFTPRNSWNFTREQTYREPYDGYRCKLENEDKGFIEDELIVVPVGDSVKSAKNLNLVEFPGVTNPKRVRDHARYRLAEAKLRPAKITLNVDFEHLVATLGDRVAVTHDVLMNATLAGARVRSVSGQQMVLDETFALANGVEYWMRFRRPQANAASRSVARRIQTDNTVGSTLTLAGTGTMPAVGDLCSIVPVENGIYRVKNIRPMDELSAEIELVDDAPAIQDADTEEVPDYDSGIVAPVDLTAFPPFRLKVKEAKVKVKGRLVSRTTLSWDVRTVAEVRFFEITGTDPKGKKQTWRTKDGRTLSYSMDNLRAGRWRWRIKSCFPNSRRNKTSAELREAS